MQGYNPISVGHRGFFTVLENSLIAFQEAINQKLPMVELDIWLTKDKIPVVIHTDGDTSCISATANGKGKVKEFTFDEIRQFTLGKDQKIPSLEEVFVLCKDKLIINVEIKEIDDKERIVKEALALADKYSMRDQIQFSSFMHDYYDIVRANSDITFKYLVDTEEEVAPLFKLPKEKLIKTDLVSNSTILTKDKVDFFHNLGQKVAIYLYPDPTLREEHIKYLLDIRVDEFIVDEPTKCRDMISQYLSSNK